MVIGDRFSQSTAKNIPWIKDFFNRLGASLVGSFLNIKTDDLTCGFRRIIAKRCSDSIIQPVSPIPRKPLSMLSENLRVVWVPVQVTYFADRKSKIVKSVYSFVNNSARIILKAVRDVRPPNFFGIPGPDPDRDFHRTVPGLPRQLFPRFPRLHPIGTISSHRLPPSSSGFNASFSHLSPI